MASGPSEKSRDKRHWPRILDLAPWWLALIGLFGLMVLMSILGPDPAPYVRPE